ncbi:MAG: flavin reductase [Actinobacteria bacterium]|nr:flavin reductase [Actinomycetota bacterium]
MTNAADSQFADKAEYRRVFGHLPTGVVVITGVGAAGEPLGITIGSFSSISLDPAARSANGSPVLPGVVATIDCSLRETRTLGDHDLVVGAVTDVRVLSDGAAMVFFKGKTGDAHITG